MARLWSSGFELNSATAGVEMTAVNSVTIDSTTFRSGAYSLKIDSSLDSTRITYRSGSGTQESIFVRFYLRLENHTSALTDIFAFLNNTSVVISVRVDTDGHLELWNVEDNAQIGSDSSILSTDTWYQIEVNTDTSTLAATTASARIDGVEFASGSSDLSVAFNGVMFRKSAGVSGDWNIDDVAINDTTGSSQNSWPGEGEIIHLRPNAAGDNAAWTDVPSDTNHGSVDEVTPDDATTIVQSSNTGDIDDYNIDATPAALASDDTINCVQVGFRFRKSTTSGNPNQFKVRIKASASGTVEESAAITYDATGWVTNAAAAPRNHPLTLYDLPGASTTAWTKSDLDSAQIGINHSDRQAGNTEVSTIWLLVDHKPTAAAGSPQPSNAVFMGINF